MIATNTTLTSLNLSKNRIRDQGVEWLVKGLSQNKTLRTLNLRWYVREHRVSLNFSQHC